MDLKRKLSKFKCKCKPNCYDCCGQIQMSIEEKAKLDNIMPIPPYGKGKEYCEYLDKEGKCSVYNHRPIICRAFGTVNSTFLKCKHVEGNYVSKDLEKELHDYCQQCNREGVLNLCAREANIITKVKEGDLEAIRKILVTIAHLYQDGMISEEEFEKRVSHYQQFYKQMKNSDLLTDLKINI